MKKPLIMLLSVIMLLLCLSPLASAGSLPGGEWDFGTGSLPEDWKLSDATEASYFENEEDGGCFALSGFSSLEYGPVRGIGYSLDASVDGQGADFCGLLFNYTGGEKPLYENNGAAPDGDSLCGENGIMVSFRQTGLEIAVKTTDGAMRIATDKQGTQLSVRDENGVFSLWLDEVPVCRVEYSALSDGMYTSARVTDGEGTVLGETAHALISAEKSAAFITRATTLKLSFVRVTPIFEAASISVTEALLYPEEGELSITAEYNNARYEDTWFGLYPADTETPEGANSLGIWCYGNGTRTPSELTENGTVVLTQEVCNSISAVTEGDYRLFMFASDSGSDPYEVIAFCDLTLDAPEKEIPPNTGDGAVWMSAAAIFIAAYGIYVCKKQRI